MYPFRAEFGQSVKGHEIAHLEPGLAQVDFAFTFKIDPHLQVLPRGRLGVDLIGINMPRRQPRQHRSTVRPAGGEQGHPPPFSQARRPRAHRQQPQTAVGLEFTHHSPHRVEMNGQGAVPVFPAALEVGAYGAAPCHIEIDTDFLQGAAHVVNDLITHAGRAVDVEQRQKRVVQVVHINGHRFHKSVHLLL